MELYLIHISDIISCLMCIYSSYESDDDGLLQADSLLYAIADEVVSSSQGKTTSFISTLTFLAFRSILAACVIPEFPFIGVTVVYQISARNV